MKNINGGEYFQKPEICERICIHGVHFLYLKCDVIYSLEFRKTDRSLMVSPDGSSRVPFDPQQKPLFGVLKSPAAIKAQTTNGKKSNGRPTAADFF